MNSVPRSPAVATALNSIPAREPARINGDLSALGRVFWNLFDNAVKYSPGQPTVWVTLESGGGHCVVSVKDRDWVSPPGSRRRSFANLSVEKQHEAKTSPEPGSALPWPR